MSSTASTDYYTITIKSSKHAPNGIFGNMPKSFGFRLWSSWASLLGGLSPASFGLGGAIAEAALNTTGRSFTNQYTTLQTWTGSSPLEITLPIQFFASTNAQTDVHNNILLLSQVLMPSLDPNNNQNRFFIPPGPAPFVRAATTAQTSSAMVSELDTGVGQGISSITRAIGSVLAGGPLSVGAGQAFGGAQGIYSSVTSLFNATTSQVAQNRDNITVKIGNFMTMTSMILVGLEVTYSGQMSHDGFPMSAEALCTFRSLYTLSGDDLKAMFTTEAAGPTTLSSIAKNAISSVGSRIEDIVNQITG